MAQPTCDVAELVWIPYDWISRSEGETIMRELTIKPRSFRDEPVEPIKTYVLDNESRRIGVPIHYGLHLVANLGRMHEATYFTSDGVAIKPRKFPDPRHPKAAPGQDVFMEDMLREVRARRTVLGVAPTGSGKTVTCLDTIGRLGLTALVIVPSKQLAHQWVKEAKEHLGFTDSEIGFVGDGKMRWKGCSIVVGIVHTISRKELPQEFFEYFGTGVWDEAHRLGSRSFAESMRRVVSTYKIAVTATPDRKDGCKALFIDHFGPPCVFSRQRALEADCIVHRYVKAGNPYPATLERGTIIRNISKDEGRNNFIVSRGVARYREGRNMLFIGDRVEHLQVLGAMLNRAGIPERDIGLYTGYFVDDEGRKTNFTRDQLEAVKSGSRVILATYGMMKEGIDIPRLDWGMDVTPRAEGTQVIGRIRRPFPDKPRPIWETILDVKIPQMHRVCESRLRDYRNNNVNILNNGTQQTSNHTSYAG